MTDNYVSFHDVITSAAVICTLAVLLAVAVVTDLRSHRIPNILLAPALSLALLIHTINGGADSLLLASAGFVTGLAMFLPLYLIGGLAGGDVKLLAVVGCFVGPWGAVVTGLATMMVGAVLGIVVIAWRRIRPALDVPDMQLPESEITTIAYAPAIAAGTLFALWYIGYSPARFLGWTV
jgi:Flp pilus assembly protein protease CpaA